MENATQPKKITSYRDAIVKTHSFVRDKIKYVLINGLSGQGPDAKNIFLFEWFDFETPAKIIFDFINNIEPIKKDEYILILKLNNKTEKTVDHHDERTLRCLCSSHIMEFTLVRKTK